MRGILALTLCCLVIAAATGCGGDSNDNKTTSTAPIGGNNQGSLGPPTILTFKYNPGHGKPVKTARLTCKQGGDAIGTGYLKETSGAACGQAAKSVELLTKGPDTTKTCASVYEGPQTLTVSGRVAYKTVDQTFKRTNSCESDAWADLDWFLPENAPG